MGVPICGPKVSVCCLVIGIWGMIQLPLMGIFLRIHSPTFFEDMPINETEWENTSYSVDYVYDIYDQASTNCFIAGGAYLAIFALSFVMWRINKRNNYMTA